MLGKEVCSDAELLGLVAILYLTLRVKKKKKNFQKYKHSFKYCAINLLKNLKIELGTPIIIKYFYF
jgi:hypothetical protein